MLTPNIPMSATNPSLRALMDARAAEVLFQPIVSVKRQDIIGVEARHQASDGGRRISYEELNELAVAQNLTVEMDRWLRQLALTRFTPVHAANPQLLLFLNFDTSIIDQGVVGSGQLLHMAQNAGVPPHNIVIEIMEARVRDVEALIQFIRFYRERGFLIALEGVGSGHSNLVRIAQTRPDILKIDPALVENLTQEHYRQEIFKAVVNMARDLGALAVADGVAAEEDAVLALELGADMLQGPHIAAPLAELPLESGPWKDQIGRLVEKYKEDSIARAKAAKQRSWEHEKTFGKLVKALAEAPAESFDGRLVDFCGQETDAECLYVLDEEGRQITDTVAKPGRALEQRKLFWPAQKGADHSSKEYYYLLLDTYVNKFVTNPYTSLATGHLCVTVSGSFTNAQGRKFILCVDFPAEP